MRNVKRRASRFSVNRCLGFVSVTLFAAFILQNIRPEAPKASVASSLVRSPKPKTVARVAATPQKQINLASAEVPEACTRKWNSVLNLDFQTIYGETGSVSSVKLSAVLNPNDYRDPCDSSPQLKEVNRLQSDFAASCSKPEEENSSCVDALIGLKAELAKLLLRDTDVATVTNPQVLKSLLLDAMTHEDFDPKQKKAVAERLLQLEPGRAPALNLVTALRMKSLTDDPGSPEAVEAMEDAVHKQNVLHPGSLEVSQLRMKVALTEGDYSMLSEACDRAETAFPESPLANYYRAKAAFEQGNYSTSADYLLEAQSTIPDNRGLKNLLAKFANGPANLAANPFVLDEDEFVIERSDSR